MVIYVQDFPQWVTSSQFWPDLSRLMWRQETEQICLKLSGIISVWPQPSIAPNAAVNDCRSVQPASGLVIVTGNSLTAIWSPFLCWIWRLWPPEIVSCSLSSPGEMLGWFAVLLCLLLLGWYCSVCWLVLLLLGWYCIVVLVTSCCWWCCGIVVFVVGVALLCLLLLGWHCCVCCCGGGIVVFVVVEASGLWWP